MAHSMRRMLIVEGGRAQRRPPKEDLAFFLVSFATSFIILYSFLF